ncbi:uncharacterized protein [Epargyreus clarus]|uniref:uncharacterized protein n=1 Tax=Epargyreus clarus TaxID=520877 RepID=UPI003C30A628
MYDKVEEIYLDYKCELQCQLSKFQVKYSTPSHTAPPISIAKLPKINIPSFSGRNANGETNPTPLVSCFAKDTIQQQVLLATALVEATSRNGVGYKVRALLDQGSQSSFVTESTAQYLGLNKTLIKGKITGLGGDKQIISKAMITIEIKSLINSDVRIPVKAYVLKNITSLLPTRKVEKLDWPELKELVLADPQFDVPNHIDLLLGAETYSQILQEGMKKGPFGNLIAQATSFGWILSGMVNPSNDPISQIQVMHCCTESNDMLKRFWELESDQRQPKETMFTDNEKRCEQYFKETTQRDEDGRYIVRLPFRNGTPEVTASREIAEKRLKLLENRLNKNKTMKATYQEVIEEYLHLDHMEVVPKNEIDNDKSIYLPHHAVVKNDRQTTKVRIVYDASCKGKNNLSLNDQLLVGPKLQPELRCIVMQWRISPICMSADIAKMYRQIKVNQRDADCQRILWRENDKEEIKSYRLTRVTFGTASAPYLAVKALQQVAHDHGVNYPSAAENILKHFYVDDLMTGVNSVEEGKTVYKEMNELIIYDAHKQTLHGGLQLTLAYILSKYWILGGKQLIKSHNRQCVTCVKNSAVTRNPLMGQMPAARVTPTRPFSHSGVDYAGPIQIRTTKGRGHKSHKGYICLFICMATRAIHLEVVTDLTTEGFLQAFKRFVARRGNCSQLWSDNGTNFVGAATELQKRSFDEYRRMHQEVAEALAINHCEWHFIPPHSPNFGGLWEAGVKSVKYHLKRVVGNSTLTYEEMATVLAQIEACLNSRPMLALNDQPDDFTVLTPGHFLIGEPPVAAPDYDFEKSNVSSLRRWQHTQRMLQTFWRQWSQEYLTKFLHRYKWTDRQSQPSLGDVVVIKEDHLPPCRWLYGLITATHPGEDKVVRVVSLKTKTGILKRPVSKLCFLPIEK